MTPSNRHARNFDRQNIALTLTMVYSASNPMPQGAAMKRLHLLIAALIFVLLTAATARTQDKFFTPVRTKKDVERTLGVDWYGVYLQNKKIGSCKIDRARAGDKIVESFAMNMKLVVFNKKADMKITRQF